MHSESRRAPKPWRTTRKWLDARPTDIGRFRRWRRTVFDGDLDAGLISREDENMNTLANELK